MFYLSWNNRRLTRKDIETLGDVTNRVRDDANINA